MFSCPRLEGAIVNTIKLQKSTSSHAVPHSALPSQLKPLQLLLPSWQIPALPLKRLVAARPRGEGSQHHKTRRSYGISVIFMDLWSVMEKITKEQWTLPKC